MQGRRCNDVMIPPYFVQRRSECGKLQKDCEVEWPDYFDCSRSVPRKSNFSIHRLLVNISQEHVSFCTQKAFNRESLASSSHL